MLLDYIDQHFTEEQQSDIAAAFTYLSKRQFFIVAPGARVSVRNALVNPKTRSVLKDMAHLTGHTLIFEEAEGWYGIIPRDEFVQARSMSAIDTLVVLIIANSYDKLFASANLDAQANAVTSYNVFADEVAFYVAQCGMAEIKNAALLASLEKLRAMNAIELKAVDEEAQDRDLLIRPFVRRLAGPDAIKKIKEYGERIKNPDKGKGRSEVLDEETDDIIPETPEEVSSGGDLFDEPDVDDPERQERSAPSVVTPTVLKRPSFMEGRVQ
jgi:hypothetical protein